MGGMTVDEILKDIGKRCGQSEEVIRDVLRAETESAEERLRKGERATLMGRCTLTPVMGQKLGIGQGIALENELKVKAKATAMENRLKDVRQFETKEDNEAIPACIRIHQVPGLL